MSEPKLSNTFFSSVQFSPVNFGQTGPVGTAAVPAGSSAGACLIDIALLLLQLPGLEISQTPAVVPS